MTHQPTILIGDVCDQLANLPAGSVHCVVTSPPYWGLRDYSTCSCAHRLNAGSAALAMSGTTTNGASGQSSATDPRCHKEPDPACAACHGTGKIAGTEAQIGLEPTFDCGAWAARLYGFEPKPCPGCFICAMVRVFEGVWRVLRDDGTCWVNMGDSYSAGGKNRDQDQAIRKSGLQGGKRHQIAGMKQINKAAGGLGCKQRYMQPATLAKALQAHGWTLRDEIIWDKPNPMPESVTDRTTKAHEMIYLLTKGPRYFYDQEAVRESTTGNAHANGSGSRHRQKLAEPGSGTKNNASMAAAINNATAADLPTSRNARSVWRIKPQAFPEAHFATYPVELPTRCIKAGASARGCCPACGAPWMRALERVPTGQTQKMPDGMASHKGGHGSIHKDGREKGKAGVPVMANRTTGWVPTCECPPELPGACTVLDPFSGSGTTGIAAILLGHRYIGIELNPEYAAMSIRRIAHETRPSTSRAGKDEPSPLFAEAE